jgi:hypothetical protein
MKIRCLYLVLGIMSAALICLPGGATGQTINFGPKKLACDQDHLSMTTTATNSRDIALQVVIGVILRDGDERCLQGLQQEMELQPGESREIKFAFDTVPCVEGKYRTDHKVLHDYVPRMVRLGKFDDLFRNPVLDGVPGKYQNLFKNFDSAAQEQLINAVKSGDFESRLKDEFDSFMLQCP